MEKSLPNNSLAQKELVKLILEVTDANYIYISPGITPTRIITILIDYEKETIPTTLITSLSETFEELLGRNFRIYRIQTAREELEQGNLYFLRNCVCGKLLYHSPDLSYPDLFKNVGPKEAIQKARTWFFLEMDKINALRKVPTSLKTRKIITRQHTLSTKPLSCNFAVLKFLKWEKAKPAIK